MGEEEEEEEKQEEEKKRKLEVNEERRGWKLSMILRLWT